ncbi:hypothetical protein [Streptomyces sp. NPDC059761]|uniref:hypothetical protein n=1 Tax=Streptomyces sp. NPDC059761 TaxID=3346937 RepID=UPI0036563514
MSAPPPPPPPPSWLRRMRTSHSGLRAEAKFGLWSLVIAVITLGVQILPGDDGKGDAKPEARPPASMPTPTLGNSRPSAPGSASSTSPSSSPRSYEVVFKDQTMSLGVPQNGFASLDFDAPATRQYTSDEWTAMRSNSKETGTLREPDLSYGNPLYGYLALVEGRNAAQLRPESAPATVEDCACSAQAGGFTEATMGDWKLPRDFGRHPPRRDVDVHENGSSEPQRALRRRRSRAFGGRRIQPSSQAGSRRYTPGPTAGGAGGPGKPARRQPDLS